MSIPRILIIDDEPMICRCLAQWLTEKGYQSAVASNADEGWSYLETHDVDLVTLDNQLPGASGFEMLDRLTLEMPDVSVLMVTAEVDAKKAIRAMARGAVGYVLKPVKRDELLAQIDNALERRRLAIENRELTERLQETVRQQTAEIRTAHEETIYRLVGAAVYRDEETGEHVRRTGRYSELLAATIGWPKERVDIIRLAAPMHDIGKIGIGDAILRKTGNLTQDEMSLMQTHTLIGGKLLEGSVSPILQMARDIALTHHERWDGAGYPRGLSGEAIPEAGRIVAIVDVFDALSHDRVYRPAFSDAVVEQIMWEGRATHFDPSLLDAFMSILPEMRAISAAMADDQRDALLADDSDQRTIKAGRQKAESKPRADPLGNVR